MQRHLSPSTERYVVNFSSRPPSFNESSQHEVLLKHQETVRRLQVSYEEGHFLKGSKVMFGLAVSTNKSLKTSTSRPSKPKLLVSQSFPQLQATVWTCLLPTCLMTPLICSVFGPIAQVPFPSYLQASETRLHTALT